MNLTYKDLEAKYSRQYEVTDEEELFNFKSIQNDFTNSEMKNYCLDLITSTDEYKGSDKEFKEIMELLNITVTEGLHKNTYQNSINTIIYFTLKYSGNWLSRFDLVNITIVGDKFMFDLIKKKYALRT